MIPSQSSKNQISDFQQSAILNQETQSLQVLNDTYADGGWDAALGIQPEPYQWHSADYRRGYTDKLQEKLSA